MPRQAISPDTVTPWIQHLSGEGRGLQHLCFDLHEDLPLASLKAFLAALDALPALQSLDLRLIPRGTPKQVADCRHALAGSLVCLQLSLEVRRYLRCRAQWASFDELCWQDFFGHLHCKDVPSRGAQRALDENAQANLRAMAMIACKLGEGPLLKALKTLWPGLHLRFATGLPTRRQQALLLKRRIPIRVELPLEHADMLPGLCRLLRHPRLRLPVLHLKFQLSLDKTAAATLLTALMQSRHLNVLSLHVHKGVRIDWPEELVERMRAASSGLSALTLNLFLFENCRELTAPFVRAWSPKLLNLHFHREVEWALLSEERFAHTLTQLSSLRLRIDDFVVYGEVIFQQLQQRLQALLQRPHSIQDLRVIVSCTCLDEVSRWTDWQNMAVRSAPLQYLSVTVRHRERDTSVSHSQWCWSSEALLRQAHGLSALPGALGFMQTHKALPKDVGDWLLQRCGLGPRDWFALSQASAQTREAVLDARRRVLRPQLLRLASCGLLTEERLRAVAGLGRFSAPDRPLLEALRQDMLAENVGADQLALVQGLLGQLALQALEARA